MPIITLTTDYGTADWFVGSMKGVILALNAQITIVDVTHDVPAGDIRAGAFVLHASSRCFPRNTVHVVVVDPSVGSSRAGLAVRTTDYFFVGPDNGVLSLALAQENIVEIRRLENEQYFRKPVSPTFHGRDIFAPVAARLTQGIIIDSLGSKMSDYTRLSWSQPKSSGTSVDGEVIHIDRFGNAITNIDLKSLKPLTARAPKVLAKDCTPCEIRRFYQEVPEGQSVAVFGSTGLLEIAVNGGHAARALGLNVGDAVTIT